MHLIPTHQLTVSRAGLHKIQLGIYATEAPRGPQHAHLLRTQAALSRRQGPHAASHISAAVAHRLPLFDEDLSVVHLMTDEPGRRGRRAGVHVHEGPIEDAVATAGIMVTPLARTLLDCARTLPRDQAVAMADYALHHRLTRRRSSRSCSRRARAGGATGPGERSSSPTAGRRAWERPAPG